MPSKMADFIDLLYFKTTMAVRPVFHMPSIKWLLASVFLFRPEKYRSKYKVQKRGEII